MKSCVVALLTPASGWCVCRLFSAPTHRNESNAPSAHPDLGRWTRALTDAATTSARPARCPRHVVDGGHPASRTSPPRAPPGLTDLRLSDLTTLLAPRGLRLSRRRGGANGRRRLTAPAHVARDRVHQLDGAEVALRRSGHRGSTPLTPRSRRPPASTRGSCPGCDRGSHRRTPRRPYARDRPGGHRRSHDDQPQIYHIATASDSYEALESPGVVPTCHAAASRRSTHDGSASLAVAEHGASRCSNRSGASSWCRRSTPTGWRCPGARTVSGPRPPAHLRSASPDAVTGAALDPPIGAEAVTPPVATGRPDRPPTRSTTRGTASASIPAHGHREDVVGGGHARSRSTPQTAPVLPAAARRRPRQLARAAEAAVRARGWRRSARSRRRGCGRRRGPPARSRRGTARGRARRRARASRELEDLVGGEGPQVARAAR